VSNSLEIVGWLGAACFAICGAPQAYKCWKEKNAKGISWGLILLWTLGEALTLLYVLPKKDLPLIFNYLANLGFLSIILTYKIKDTRSKYGK